MTDGGLRALFAKNIPGDWLSVETWSTGRGVFDANYCIKGCEGWIEFKVTEGWRVTMRPEQVAWSERRVRNGGRTFIAVRRRCAAGPRRASADELWLFPGTSARTLFDKRIDQTPFLLHHENGPTCWDWAEVADFITK